MTLQDQNDAANYIFYAIFIVALLIIIPTLPPDDLDKGE